MISTSSQQPARVRIRGVTAFERPVALRMPFRLGRMRIDELAILYVYVDAECDHRLVRGVGASVLSPSWFDKSSGRDHQAKRAALVTSIAVAADGYLQTGIGTPWDLHRSVQPAVRAICGERGVNALTSSFGVAMIDSAVVDALCRSRSTNLHDGLRADLFGVGRLPWLPPQPSRRLTIRHTIGLADPLTEGDLETPLSDGLPETLIDVVRTYGLHLFKIKVTGDGDANLDRLRAIGRILQDAGLADYRVVLDGNEAFDDFAAFQPFIEQLAADQRARPVVDRLLWIEQPVTRDAALAHGVAADVRRASAFCPLILDESDATDETVEEALDIGYAGVSAKNCKGVFRTLHAAQVLSTHSGSILSAEDLTNPAVAPLHQDTAVVAALGLRHAERNGHHYIRGLAHLTEAEQRAAVADYPALYETGHAGLVRLRVRSGAIDVSELNTAPYGLVSPPDLTSMSPLPLTDERQMNTHAEKE